MAEGRVQQSTLRGIAWLSFGVTCFAVIDAIAKALSDTVGPIQITWARYAFFLLPLLVLTPVRLWAGAVRGPRLRLNLLRATIPAVAGLCAVLGLAITPLDLFTAVSFAAPLVVTALSGPMLGEHPGLRRWAAVVVGFGGILIIARPWDDAIGLGVAFALALAVLFALYQVLTRKLTEGGEPRAMLLQVALIGFILTSLALPFGWRDVGLDDWVLMVVSGIVHAAAHFSILRAFALAPASTLAPFIYVQIVGAILLGYFWFGYVPDWTTIAGTAVVVACGLYIVHRERLQRARASL